MGGIISKNIQLEGENERLKLQIQQLDTLQREHDTLQQLHKEALQEVDRLKKQRNVVIQRALAENNQRMAELQQERDDVKERNLALSNTVDDHVHQLTELRQEHESAVQRINTMTPELAELQQERDDVKERNLALSNTVDDHVHQLTELRQEHESAVQRINTMTPELAELQQERDDVVERNQALSGHVQTLTDATHMSLSIEESRDLWRMACLEHLRRFPGMYVRVDAHALALHNEFGIDCMITDATVDGRHTTLRNLFGIVAGPPMSDAERLRHTEHIRLHECGSRAEWQQTFADRHVVFTFRPCRGRSIWRLAIAFDKHGILHQDPMTLKEGFEF